MIGPSLPPGMGNSASDSVLASVTPELPSKPQLPRTRDVLDGEPEIVRQHCRGIPTTSQRMDAIGPAAMPPRGQPLLGQEVHTKIVGKVKGPTMPIATNEATTVSKAIVAACRSGELPERNWSAKWNVATKQAALVAALETAQMHVVYALRPHSPTFQENVSAESLGQADMDRLLRNHALLKFKVKKSAAHEAIVWLIEAGANIESLCCDADFGARTAAARIISGMDQDGFTRCMNLLCSEDWRARASAVEALGYRTNDAAPYTNAVAGLLADDEALVRTAAISTLSKIGAPVATRCADFLKSDRPRAREAAVEVLGRIGPAAAEHSEAIAELLQDNDWQVPTAAANALQKIGGSAAKHCAAVLSRCEPMAMAAAVEALVRVGGVQAADAAAELTRNEDPHIRRHAVEALGQIGQVATSHAAILNELCNDVDREVRIAARGAQGKLGIRIELPSLVGNGDELPQFVGKGKGKGRVRHEPSEQSQNGSVGGKGASRGSASHAGTRHEDRTMQSSSDGRDKRDKKSRSRDKRRRSRNTRSRSRHRHKERESEYKSASSSSRRSKQRDRKRPSQRSRSTPPESRKKSEGSSDSSSS